jgi:PAS domain S-box-containing protein
MSRFPGVGQRIRQRFKALGYWKDGRPDVGRFCADKAYRPQYLYAWLADRIPSYDNLARLGRDLEVPAEWIMFGAGPAARRDGPGADGARGPRGGGQIIDFARLRDVTTKLVRLETELEAIFRASPDLYFWLDTEGTVLAYEGSRASDFDVLPELALGKKIVDMVSPESGLRLETALRQSLDAPSPVSTELTMGAKSCEARLLPLPGGGGAEPQLLMIVHDITERKQAEEAARALAHVGHELVGTLDLAQASERVVTAVLGHFRGDRASLFEVERASGNLVCVATAGESDGDQWKGRVSPPGSSVAALAVRDRRPVCARDVTSDRRLSLPAWLRERAVVEGHTSVVAVPLIARGDVLGALALASRSERVFSEAELGLLSGFADAAALALENARRFQETEQGKARAQEAAAHSERRLRSLAQDLTAIVWEADAATWRTLYVSHTTEAILGYPVERWYTEEDFWLAHLYPDDRVRFLRMRLEPDSREDHELEYRMIAADGRVVWLSDFVHVVTDDHGVARRLHGVMVDITEAKRAAEATRALAEINRLLAPSLDRDQLAHRIADSVRHLVDAAVALLYQLEPGSAEMIAVARSTDDSALDWSLPPETGLVELALRERRAVVSPDILAELRVTYAPDVRARIELGTVRAVLAVPLIARGALIGALAVGDRAGRVFDERDTRLAEAFADQAAVALAGARLHEEASRARDFLRSLVVNRTDVVLTTDVHGRIAYWSPWAETVCGWEADELIGRHVSDFYKGGMDEARALMRRLRAEARIRRYRTTLRKKGGGWVELDMGVALARDDRGAVVGTVGTVEGAAT